MGRTRGDQVRPEPLPDRSRQDIFEILQRRPAEPGIARIQAAKCDLERLPRQNEREQREDMSKALAGTITNELVERGFADETVQ